MDLRPESIKKYVTVLELANIRTTPEEVTKVLEYMESRKDTDPWLAQLVRDFSGALLAFQHAEMYSRNKEKYRLSAEGTWNAMLKVTPGFGAEVENQAQPEAVRPEDIVPEKVRFRDRKWFPWALLFAVLVAFFVGLFAAPGKSVSTDRQLTAKVESAEAKANDLQKQLDAEKAKPKGMSEEEHLARLKQVLAANRKKLEEGGCRFEAPVDSAK